MKLTYKINPSAYGLCVSVHCLSSSNEQKSDVILPVGNYSRN